MGLVTQQDPIGFAGGLNLYGYANGDPINYSDPFGLDPCEQDEETSTQAIDPECNYQEPEEAGAVKGKAGAFTALVTTLYTWLGIGDNPDVGLQNVDEAVDVSRATSANPSDEVIEEFGRRTRSTPVRVPAPAGRGAITGTGKPVVRRTIMQGSKWMPFVGAALTIGDFLFNPEPLGAGTLQEYCVQHPDSISCQ